MDIQIGDKIKELRKARKITQEQLSSTLLEYGEIVYNTTKNEFTQPTSHPIPEGRTELIQL